MDKYSWHFIIHPNNRWSWQRLNEDGSLDRMSAITGEFGRLMSDARLHGFNPDGDRWVVWDRKWRTYYAPGVEPKLVARTSTPEAAPADPATLFQRQQPSPSSSL